MRSRLVLSLESCDELYHKIKVTIKGTIQGNSTSSSKAQGTVNYLMKMTLSLDFIEQSDTELARMVLLAK